MSATRPGAFNPGPWELREVVTIGLVDAVALGALGLSAYAAAGRSATSDQMPWLNVAAAAAIILVAANVSWLAMGRRSVARQGRRVRSALLRVLPEATVPAHMGSPRDTDGPRVVASPPMRWYHRPGCRLAAGKPVTASSAASHQAAGRRPCGVCAP